MSSMFERPAVEETVVDYLIEDHRRLVAALAELQAHVQSGAEPVSVEEIVVDEFEVPEENLHQARELEGKNERIETLSARAADLEGQLVDAKAEAKKHKSDLASAKSSREYYKGLCMEHKAKIAKLQEQIEDVPKPGEKVSKAFEDKILHLEKKLAKTEKNLELAHDDLKKTSDRLRDIRKDKEAQARKLADVEAALEQAKADLEKKATVTSTGVPKVDSAVAFLEKALRDFDEDPNAAFTAINRAKIALTNPEEN